MKHDFIDRYARLESPVHSIDPRAKIIALFVLIFACVTTPPRSWWPFCVYAALVVTLAVASRVPAGYLMSRMLVVVPFILLVAVFVPFLHRGGGSVDLKLFHLSRDGLLMLWNVTAKSLTSVACLILLSSTTPFGELLNGFERLHVPRFFTTVAAFMYRYLFIMVDEAQRMKRARDSRNYRARWVWQVKVIGHMVASLFIRSQERAERVYQAMLSRGFDGTFPAGRDRRMGAGDYIFMVMFSAAAVAGRLAVLWT